MEKNLLKNNGLDSIVSLLELSCPDHIETINMPVMEGSFGDTSAIITFPNLSLWVKRDRGEIYIDLGREDIGWYCADYIISYLNNKNNTGNISHIDARASSKFIINNWNIVVNIFNDGLLLSNLKAFIEEANKMRWSLI